MALYDRIQGDIPTHAFNAALRRWAGGSSLITRAAIISTFALVGDDITDLDAIASTYSGLTPGVPSSARQDYLMQIEDIFILIEQGLLTEAQAKSELGF